jgi:hypothetical protein
MKRRKPAEIEARSSIELDTLEKHFDEFSVFAGEWFLVKGEHLLAHSRDYREIRAEIEKLGLTDCLVHYVPTVAGRDFALI